MTGLGLKGRPRKEEDELGKEDDELARDWAGAGRAGSLLVKANE